MAVADAPAREGRGAVESIAFRRWVCLHLLRRKSIVMYTIEVGCGIPAHINDAQRTQSQRTIKSPPALLHGFDALLWSTERPTVNTACYFTH